MPTSADKPESLVAEFTRKGLPDPEKAAVTAFLKSPTPELKEEIQGILTSNPKKARAAIIDRIYEISPPERRAEDVKRVDTVLFERETTPDGKKKLVAKRETTPTTIVSFVTGRELKGRATPEPIDVKPPTVEKESAVGKMVNNMKKAFSRKAQLGTSGPATTGAAMATQAFVNKDGMRR